MEETKKMYVFPEEMRSIMFSNVHFSTFIKNVFIHICFYSYAFMYDIGRHTYTLNTLSMFLQEKRRDMKMKVHCTLKYKYNAKEAIFLHETFSITLVTHIM